MVIGVDEVGRGALAGPVTIGAVAVDRTCGTPPTDIRDSKALSQKRRQDACPAIRAWAIDAAVVHIPAERINEVGITQALGEGAAQAAGRSCRCWRPPVPRQTRRARRRLPPPRGAA